MARPPRDEAPGGFYHVTARGNDRRRIQWDDVDCGAWERLLAKAARRHAWELLSYCLLTNHFHLVLRIPEGGLSAGMGFLNGAYARQMNRRHGRLDHLFGRRFWSRRIGDDAYLRRSLNYLAWNPVRAGLAATPEDYRWSSTPALAGLAQAPTFLSAGTALGLFASNPRNAPKAYLTHLHERRATAI